MEAEMISFPVFGEGFIIDPPTYISIFGFKLYLYGLFIALGFILAGLYIYRRRSVFDLTKDNVLDMIILAVPCGIIGARLYYAVFNFSDYFGPGNWLNIFRVREGGLAVYGGVIGGVVGFCIYSRIKKIPVGKLFDAAGFGLFIGQAIGRWGNFFNREAFGTLTDVPWKMGLTIDSNTIYVHPTFLYESLWNTIGFIMLHLYSKLKKTKYHGQYFLCYVAWYGFGRFFIEGLRADSLFIGDTNIRVSQLLAALSFLAAITLLIRNRLRGTNSPESAGGEPVSELPDETPEPGEKDNSSVTSDDDTENPDMSDEDATDDDTTDDKPGDSDVSGGIYAESDVDTVSSDP